MAGAGLYTAATFPLYIDCDGIVLQEKLSDAMFYSLLTWACGIPGSAFPDYYGTMEHPSVLYSPAESI